MTLQQQHQPENKKNVGFFQKIFSFFSNLKIVRYFTDTRVLYREKKNSNFSKHFLKKAPFYKIKNIKHLAVSMVEHSRTLRFIHRFTNTILQISMRSIGMFFLAFGLFFVTSSVLLSSRYSPQTQMQTWLLSAGLILFALILLFSQKNLHSAITTNRFFSYIFFDILGLRQIAPAEEEQPKPYDALAFLLGILLALPSLFLLPVTVFKIYALTLLAYLTLLTPESGWILLILFLPFCSVKFLFFAFLFVAFSYFCKLLLSKRSLHFTKMDYPLILFLLALLCFGIPSISPAISAKETILYAILLIGYYLTTNMIRTAPWLRRCLLSLSFSCFLATFTGLIQYLLYVLNDKLPHTKFSIFLSGSPYFSKLTPNGWLEHRTFLAQFIIALLPLLFALLLVQGKEKQPLFILPAIILSVACLIFTYERGAWIATIFSFLLLWCFLGKRLRIFITSLLLAIAISIPFLPNSLIQGILTFFRPTNLPYAYRTTITDGFFDHISSFWYNGIGMGEEIFTQYHSYFLPADAPLLGNTHQLFLQLGISLGLIGLLCFLWVLVYVLRIFSLLQHSLVKKAHPFTQYLSCGLFCGIIALLIAGCFDYIFANEKIFFLFFQLFSLLVSLQRIYTKETAPKYGSHLNISAYSIDLPLKN